MYPEMGEGSAVGQSTETLEDRAKLYHRCEIMSLPSSLQRPLGDLLPLRSTLEALEMSQRSLMAEGAAYSSAPGVLHKRRSDWGIGGELLNSNFSIAPWSRTLGQSC